MKRATRGTLCADARRASRFVLGWILRQPRVQEESLSDWLLDNLSRKHQRIQYTLFTHHEEARVTGADWEWWFVADAGAFKLRVQAKRLKGDADNYPDIAYSNKHGMQITKLLQDATACNALPLYIFYGVGSDVVMCQKKIFDEGAFVADARVIFDSFITNGKNIVSPEDVLRCCVSLSCLFCCPLVRRMHKDLSGLAEFLYRYFSMRTPEERTNLDFSGSDLEESRGFHSRPPPEIITYLRAKKEGGIEAWLREYHNLYEELDALVVVDLREEGAT